MATLNRARNLITLRIVYDGPGEAGKTTTLRALSQRLERSCVTPEETAGRTLYFDWFSYRGGLFEGCQLECQVVSVPGQATLRQRRDYLLQTSDAIVYVAPVTTTTLSSCIAALKEHQRSDLSLGVVLQLNKRDQADALPLSEIKAALIQADLNPAIIETTANDGTGVRETFIFAVRLALDRIREQLKQGTLPEGDAEVQNADQLLARMRTHEAASQHGAPSLDSLPVNKASEDVLTLSALEQAVREASASSRPSAVEPRDEQSRPWPPEVNVPSGHIWPPIEGRVCLRDAIDCSLQLDRIDGEWWASTPNGWRFFSGRKSYFSEAERGRSRLIEMARRHTAHVSILSGPRCVVLAPDQAGGWRLWQVVRERLSMRDRLSILLGEQDDSEIARLLVDTTRRLLELKAGVSSLPDSSLRANLDTTGVFMGKTQYVGLLHDEADHEPQSDFALENELQLVLRDWSARSTQIAKALAEIESRESGPHVEIPHRLLAQIAEAHS